MPPKVPSPAYQKVIILQEYEETVESFESLENRGKAFLSKVIQKVVEEGREGSSILVTGHSYHFRAMFMHLKKTGKSDMVPLEELANGQKWIAASKNTAVSKFRFWVDKTTGHIQNIKVITWQCAKHLD